MASLRQEVPRILKHDNRQRENSDPKKIITENELAKIVVDLCLKIHKKLEPGLLETVFEEVLCFELTKLGSKFCRQQGVA